MNPCLTDPVAGKDGKERETIDESFKAANIPAQRQNLLELKDSAVEPETPIQIGIIRFRWDGSCKKNQRPRMRERQKEREKDRTRDIFSLAVKMSSVMILPQVHLFPANKSPVRGSVVATGGVYKGQGPFMVVPFRQFL